MTLLVAILVGVLPVIAASVLLVGRLSKRNPTRTARRLVLGLTGFNGLLFLFMLGLSLASLLAPSAVSASALSAPEPPADPYVTLAAAICTAVATIGAGIAVGTVGSAAVGAIAEKPESFGRALIFVGLAEGIAIYGLLISFMILNR